MFEASSLAFLRFQFRNTLKLSLESDSGTIIGAKADYWFNANEQQILTGITSHGAWALFAGSGKPIRSAIRYPLHSWAASIAPRIVESSAAPSTVTTSAPRRDPLLASRCPASIIFKS